MTDPSCSVATCERDAFSAGYCRSHLRLLRKHGTTERPPCAVAKCGKEALKRGWCVSHYVQWQKHGDPEAMERRAAARLEATCSIEGCDRELTARGWCDAHYRRWRKHDDPGTGPIADPVTDEQRFMVKVHKTDTCWIWTARINERGGYGVFYLNGKLEYAHRASYKMFVGDVPDELQLDHLCHTNDPACDLGDDCPHRACVNPDHLEPVTQAENNRRSNSLSAQQARQTHCRAAGHPFDEENTLHNNGHRSCRQCRADYRRGAKPSASA